MPKQSSNGLSDDMQSRFFLQISNDLSNDMDCLSNDLSYVKAVSANLVTYETQMGAAFQEFNAPAITIKFLLGSRVLLESNPASALWTLAWAPLVLDSPERNAS